MKSAVYFASLRAHSDQESTTVKVQRLFDRAGFSDVVAQGDRTAIKLHFGERGNDGYISPVYVRQVVEKVKACGSQPFLTDTNTLYPGSRSNAVDHITTAILHGFDFAVTGAPIRDSERAGIVLRSIPFGRCTAHGKIFYGTAKS